MSIFLISLVMLSAGMEDEKVVINNVDKYRVIDPMYECVRVVLTHKGAQYSPAYIQGITGSAFRIAGICPCAPTVNTSMETQQLVELLGYDVEYVPFSGENVDPEKRLAEVMPRIKEEIRSGNPVIVWHAFTNAEWDVVCGFDEAEKKFIGRGSYAGMEEYAVADEDRTIKCGHICDPVGVIFIGNKKSEFDTRKAELKALKEAIKHAHSREDEEKLTGENWAFLRGLMAYDRWIYEFKNDPKKVPGAGDSYCYGVYRSTHKAASDFLQEIAPKYPETSDYLIKASEYFKAETDALDKCESLIWWGSSKEIDLDRNKQVAELLTEARNNYAKAIDEIEKAVNLITLVSAY